MGWFESFRDKGSYTLYEQGRYSVSVDIPTVIIIVACVVGSLSFIINIAGTKSNERWPVVSRVLLMLHTGVVIIVTLFGHGWMESETMARTEYCEFMTADLNEMDAHIGIRLGLRSLNITLAGRIHSEEVRYNEQFWFIHHGQLVNELNSAFERGLPLSITNVLEYFSFDSGDVRWGRRIHWAGYFVFMISWASFSSWIIGNIVVCIDVLRGLFFMFLTGTLMVTSCILYATLLPKNIPLRVNESKMRLELGWCFWLCLTSGLVTLITTILALLIYKQKPRLVEIIFLTKSQRMARNVADVEDENQWKQVYLQRRRLTSAAISNRAYDEDSSTREDEEVHDTDDEWSLGRDGDAYDDDGVYDDASNTSEDEVVHDKDDDSSLGRDGGVYDKDTTVAEDHEEQDDEFNLGKSVVESKIAGLKANLDNEVVGIPKPNKKVKFIEI